MCNKNAPTWITQFNSPTTFVLVSQASNEGHCIQTTAVQRSLHITFFLAYQRCVQKSLAEHFVNIFCAGFEGRALQ